MQLYLSAFLCLFTPKLSLVRMTIPVAQSEGWKEGGSDRWERIVSCSLPWRLVCGSVVKGFLFDFLCRTAICMLTEYVLPVLLHIREKATLCVCCIWTLLLGNTSSLPYNLLSG